MAESYQASQAFHIEALCENDYREQKCDKEVSLENKLKQKERELIDKEKELVEKEKIQLKLKEMVRKRDEKIAKLQKRLKSEKQKCKRLRSKSATLKDLINNLKDKKLISDNHQEILENKFSDSFKVSGTLADSFIIHIS